MLSFLLVLGALAWSLYALRAACDACPSLDSSQQEGARLREALLEIKDSMGSLERQRDEARAASLRDRAVLHGVLAHATDPALILDKDGCIRYAAGNFEAISLESRDLLGKELFSFLSAAEASKAESAYRSAILTGQLSFAIPFDLTRADGSVVPLELRAANELADPHIAGVVASLRDLTRERLAEERARFYANFDPLTKLLNRDGFVQAVERGVGIAAKRGKILAVMAVGIDRFKRINDMYGTSAGDAVLGEVAERMRTTFRGDDVLARYRGDKFFALFPDVRTQDNVKEIIAKGRSIFQSAFVAGGEELRLTASFGVSLFPNDGAEASDIVRNAETAMYMAKESGHDGYRLFDADLNRRILERQQIESDIGEAIERGQFVPFFQPKVDRDGFIIGAEALVRWRLPSGEIKPPGYFIEVAERSGTIDKIGGMMLRMTCEAVALWRGAGLPQVPISVNLSTRQFSLPSLVPDVRAALADLDIPPSLIELEITESGIMENEKEGIRKLLQLKDLGVTVSIDDFGTGYSSFSKLKDYPIDTVKMDKSFVDPLPRDRRATIIASAIIDLAHTLSFSVIAEGVETVDQMRFLDTIFCDSFQGYLFSKPVPGEEFSTMLARGAPLLLV